MEHSPVVNSLGEVPSPPLSAEGGRDHVTRYPPDMTASAADGEDGTFHSVDASGTEPADTCYDDVRAFVAFSGKILEGRVFVAFSGRVLEGSVLAGRIFRAALSTWFSPERTARRVLTGIPVDEAQMLVGRRAGGPPGGGSGRRSCPRRR